MLDRIAIRRRFARAAASYAEASRLEAEVGARMLERLDYVKLDPRRVLDAGCGPAREAAALADRYPQATLVLLDPALPMLGTARPAGLLSRLFARRERFAICGELERMPVAASSIGLAWSNMALHWVAEPLAAIRELHRVLEPDALVMFSTLGPDSLKELRAAAGPARVHAFVDMHDIGDMLVHAGFADPVMDMEHVTLTFESPRALVAELKAIGATNRTRGRPRALMGRTRWSRAMQRLQSLARDGRIPATFEVVYGHAWKIAPRTTPEGHAIVRVQRK